jgi:hypothetical protein
MLTQAQKREALLAQLAPDTDEERVLDAVLASAAGLILNKMYPFGYEPHLEVPTRYEQIQVMLAAELYSKRGAEGQTSHSENGISRSWPEKNRLLAQIMPRVGSVISSENT